MNNFICPQEEIQIVLLMAWRYASSRHITQSAYRGDYPLAQIIIDNFGNIQNWVLNQIVEDIEYEQHLTSGKLANADYLTPLKERIEKELRRRATND